MHVLLLARQIGQKSIEASIYQTQDKLKQTLQKKTKQTMKGRKKNQKVKKQKKDNE